MPTTSSRGLSDGGLGVGEAAIHSASRLCISSCYLRENRWDYVLSIVDTFSCPRLSPHQKLTTLRDK